MRFILLYYLGILLLSLANEGFAQENVPEPTRYTCRISFQDWLEEMANYRDSVYQLENVEIYYRDDTDSLFDNEKKATKFYFVFPSEEDNLTRDRFMKNIKECMIYFQSDAAVAYKHLEEENTT